ncbi:RING-H2 finger protein ATL66-like [Arachis stenosperma]|uniref:RING-H2 finger protein ATL66-like n=1 Tax=Arachis stenosperma TaxID=217475 RepID=UPI0025ACE0E7|nr:RING-H2 finger protein ATL66-like [Arachis stenosperma]XP_057739164.1 RING-H2 finger protein ATL66-like [Arachis stenosperma]
MSTQHDSRSINWHYTELDDKDLEIRGKTLFFVIVLFSIILLTTIFFLYTRWVCRYNHHHRSSAAHARHAPQSSLPSQGLDQASIKKLPIILHQAPAEPHGGAWEETECCICLGEFVDGEKLKVLPACEHYFHCECVDKWLMQHSSCPLCRASLKLESSLPKILIQEPPIRIDIQF